MKTKIIGTGLTGLVGSRIVELLSNEYEFENLSYESGVDITNREQVKKIITDSPAGVILHLAAKTDVDSCEKDKELGEEGDAWKINVNGTKNIVEAAQSKGKKIIYISTDFVFDGENPPLDGYGETDKPNPTNWYAVTKYEAEKLVSANPLNLICRIAFPYRANFPIKKDLVRLILEKLKNGQELTMVSDQVITPTFIDDIALAIDLLIKEKTEGIYHVVGGSSYSPSDLAKLLAKSFNLDTSLIKETTRKDYYLNRAPRPFSLKLKNDKLTKLGYKMLTLEEGLERIKAQKL